MSVIAWLEAVPAPAWGLAGAIVGFLGTIAATLASNSSAGKRFREQLKHDAEQKLKDRAAELRRSVYLEAAEEAVCIGKSLGQLGGSDPRNVEAMTAGLLDFQKVAARVALVADEEGRKKITDLSGLYGKLFLELMAEAQQAHRLKIDIDINRELHADLVRERGRLISAMRDANENAESKFKFEALTRAFDNVNRRADEISKEYSDLAERHQEALISFAAVAEAKIASVSALQVEVLALLRQDLELSFDTAAMRYQTERQRKDISAAASSLISSLRQIDSPDQG